MTRDVCEGVCGLAEKKQKTKQQRMDAEIKRLCKLFAEADESRKSVMQSLIENAAFMAVTLEDLQKEINENGAVSTYKNGENQYGTKKSPEVEIYNTMIKNHAAVLKQLSDMLTDSSSQKNELMEFVCGAK